jgi:hypothetical protein
VVHSQVEVDTGLVEGLRKALARHMVVVAAEDILGDRKVVAVEDILLVAHRVVPGADHIVEEEHRTAPVEAGSLAVGDSLVVDYMVSVVEGMESDLGVEDMESDLVVEDMESDLGVEGTGWEGIGSEENAVRKAAAPLLYQVNPASSKQYEVFVALTIRWITGHDTGTL